MTPTAQSLTKLADSINKDAEYRARQNPIPPGSTPLEITTPQLLGAYLSGSLRVCAHEIRKIVKQINKQENPPHETPPRPLLPISSHL